MKLPNKFKSLRPGNRNSALLGLIPEKNLSRTEPIINGLGIVEKQGLKIASDLLMEFPKNALASCLYAAAIITAYQNNDIPENCVDLFSGLPVREPEVIQIGNLFDKLSSEEQAAIFARAAMKHIIKKNLKEPHEFKRSD